ncbi:MAG: aldo/keto reductase [Arcobacter sp.]|uniref:aldo/keto reductase n=1 Tax=uncultured Arcobacter sp. TaxID=165434 RepID=UPI000CAE39EB|nr:aldo/keto reductase [uncultured Arcobacter sp.]PLY10157.1 MAG: aldo/keto reductase [Arcobacter sp.]
MKYNQLGTTGLKVSNISLGTMTFGAEADKKESIKMFNICKDSGINLFDCANKYANGESEIILGECISSCRDEVIITTKAGSRVTDEINSLGTSRKHLMLELEKSLKRLNTDYIDIYFLHYFDSYTSIEDSMRFLDEAIKQGKILYSGVSNWAAWQIMKSIHISKSNLLNKIDCIQPMYSLIKRQAEVEIFPLAQDQQLGVMTYSPIGSGLLTGKYEEIDKNSSARLYDKKYYNQRYSSETYYDTARKFCKFAKENDYEPSALAISWAASNEAVSSSIIGARNCAQLSPNLESIKIDMTKELRDEISSLSIEPTPANDRLEEIVDEKNKLRF